MRGIPRAGRTEQALALRALANLRTGVLSTFPTRRAALTPHTLTHLTPLALHIHRLRVRRRTQLVAALDPHPLQFSLDLELPCLPLLDFGESLAQLGEFLFDRGFLGCGADALELPFFA